MSEPFENSEENKNANANVKADQERMLSEFEQQKKETQFEDRRSARAKRNRATAREAREERQKRLRRFFAIVLVIGLVLGSVITMIALSIAGKINWSGTRTQAESIEGERVTLGLNSLLSFFDEVGAGNELAQRLFSDRLLYRSEQTGKYMAAAIRSDIPHNDYDWQYLDTTDGRWSYNDGNGTQSVLGVDVSEHQGTIDWAAVAGDGIDFAMVRAVYRGYGHAGSLNEDVNARANIEGALAAGLDVGVYVFSQATTVEEAVQEADAVLELISGYDITYPVVFDLEKLAGVDTRTDQLTMEEVTACARAFCDRITEAGYHPMIYANMCGAVEDFDLKALSDIDLWFAQYYSRPFFPYAMTMLQYSDTSSVAGIEGNVDMDICFMPYGSETE